ncbi:uncharacterized protein LOC131667803 [Phymastichus coffea]|uniref:uncharacterized protein LOC131667803 n=1 Tax=Phymastichus coffea TaxID=108790 RepID=UPI00273B4E3B|nr:uncharacterized protein LOC131667803 [Phymastichus coffea]
MKSFANTTITILLVVVIVSTQDVNLLLQNKDLVDQEIGCLLQRNPCDFIGNYLKRSMSEILNGCRRCTAQQATVARILVDFMQTNYPSEYSMIIQMYDKRG